MKEINSSYFKGVSRLTADTIVGMLLKMSFFEMYVLGETIG